MLTPNFRNLLGTSVLACALVAPTPMARAQTPELRSWEYDPYTNELQVTVPPGVTPQYFVLAEPTRVVLDVSNSDIGLNPIEQNYTGMVRQIRIAQFELGTTRFVMELSPGVTLEPSQLELKPVGQGNRWVLRPSIDLAKTLPAAENTITSEDLSRSRLPSLETLPPVGLPRQPAPPVGNSDLELPVEVAPPPPQMPAVTVPGLDQLPPPASEGDEGAVLPESQGEPITAAPEVDAIATVTENNHAVSVTVPPPETTGAEMMAVVNATEPVAVTTPEPVAVTTPEPVAVTVVNPEPRMMTAAIAPKPQPNITRTQDVALAAGSFVLLSYPASAPVTVMADSPRKEILQVQVDVYDRAGNLLIPVGTPALGTFTKDGNKIRFVLQAVIINGRTLPVTAMSEPITPSSGNTQVSSSNLNGNQEGTPLVDGNAITLQPGEVLPVRLTQDWQL
ncbi:AMIN domain-containing protein [[Phormidium] sp. ETS-05]|uniref:AMIN domain-containing protein n=1 Tax=[Phormidium] sp. ETS-05 TaxID=222819 RepID=UPI0018EF03F1|nr:AMIN domain-containing protein [[Phormidium] sp. ETS-05]